MGHIVDAMERAYGPCSGRIIFDGELYQFEGSTRMVSLYLENKELDLIISVLERMVERGCKEGSKVNPDKVAFASEVQGKLLSYRRGNIPDRRRGRRVIGLA
jgi:pentatricopeptide repeat protein